MQMEIVFLPHPPTGTGSQILEILKLAAAQQIPFHILKWAFDLPLCLSPTALTDYWPNQIMGDKGGVCGVQERPSRLPAQDDCFLAVIETLCGNSAKMEEGVLMAADQGVEVPAWGKVDEMASGEGQDVGEALYLGLAGFQEVDGVWAPVHLSLDTRIGLEPDNRRLFGRGTK